MNWLTLAAVSALWVAAHGRPPTPDSAFYNPWAVTGGAGKPAISITNTNDSGAGSARAAVATCTAAGGGRITVARSVSGDVTLANTLNLSCSNATWDFGTAGNQGIQFRAYPVAIEGATNVIVRNLRVRGSGGASRDCMFIYNSTYLVIDHYSASSCSDEAIDIGKNDQSPTNHIVISNSLLTSPDEAGTSAGLVGMWRTTTDVIWYRNLSDHSESRGWKFDGNDVGVTSDLAVVESVFYDHIYANEVSTSEATGSSVVHVDFLRNVYKNGDPSGKATPDKVPIFVEQLGVASFGKMFLFGAGNALLDNGHTGARWVDINGSFSPPYANEEAFTLSNLNAADSVPTAACNVAPCAQRTAARTTTLPVPADSGWQGRAIFDYVLTHAGATAPCRDSLDAMVVDHVRKGTRGGVYPAGSTPYGGFPVLTTACPR